MRPTASRGQGAPTHAPTLTPTGAMQTPRVTSQAHLKMSCRPVPHTFPLCSVALIPTGCGSEGPWQLAPGWVQRMEGSGKRLEGRFGGKGRCRVPSPPSLPTRVSRSGLSSRMSPLPRRDRATPALSSSKGCQWVPRVLTSVSPDAFARQV